MSRGFEQVRWQRVAMIVTVLSWIMVLLVYWIVVVWWEHGMKPEMVVAVGGVVMLGALLWWVCRSAATRFSEHVIVQPTLFGQRRIDWGSVSRIEHHFRCGVRFHTRYGNFVVFSLVFSNRDRWIARLRDKAERCRIPWIGQRG